MKKIKIRDSNLLTMTNSWYGVFGKNPFGLYLSPRDKSTGFLVFEKDITTKDLKLITNQVEEVQLWP